MRLKRLKLNWGPNDYIPLAVGSCGEQYRLNSENSHPGRIWIPELKWKGDPGFDQQFVNKSLNPSWPIHEEFSDLEKILWPPDGQHTLSKSAAIRHCEVFAYLYSLSNSERRSYMKPFVEKLEEMKRVVNG